MIGSNLSLFGSSLAPQALDLAVKMTVLLLLGWLIATALRRRSAALRHFVWSLTLAGVLVLPLLSLFAPRLVFELRQPPVWGAVAKVTGRYHGTAPVRIPPARQATLEPATRECAALTVANRPLLDRATTVSPALWLALLWSGGCALVLAWGALGHAGLSRIARRATSLEGEPWRRLFRQALIRMNPSRPVRLCMSRVVGAPVTWGWRRPIVIFPASASTWPEERLRVAMEHELAHVVRRDYLFQLGAALVCAVYWFHPLVWLAARRLRAESERACDDRVLGGGTPASEYAAHLLDVARGTRVLRWGGSNAVCMARPTHLEGRLVAMLDDALPRGGVSDRARAALAAIVILLLVPFAGARPEMRTAAEPPAPRDETVVAANDKGSEVPEGDTIEKILPASSKELLTLDLETGGSIEIKGTSDKQVRIRGRLGGEDWRDTRVQVERVDGGVRLTSRQEHRNRSHSTSHDFEIQVPKEFDVRIESSGGSITITDVEGTFRGETGGGEIVLERLRGHVQLSTGGGEIRVSDTDASGSVSTGGGMVKLSKVVGGLRASSGSGPVIYADASGKSGPRAYGDLEGVVVGDSGDRIEDTRAKGAGMLNIERAGGEIVLSEAPHGADVQTGGGDIRIGRAGGKVDASTGGGDIDIGPVAGSVFASTGAGEVHVSLIDAGDEEQNVEVSCGLGRVVLELPADLDARFDLETAYSRKHGPTHIDTGSFKLEKDETTDWDDEHGTPRRYVRARGMAGKGRGLIHVRTMNGDIVVRRAGK